MMDYSGLYAAIEHTPLRPWLRTLHSQITQAMDPARHGHLKQWLELLQQLPPVHASSLDLSAPAVRIGAPDDCDARTRTQIEQRLQALHPWRKGPFNIFGIDIDSEWRSDWKWARLAPHLQPLEGRTVLDVGSGNGYYCWRLLGAGAQRVFGIDPALLYTVQFHAVKHFAGKQEAYVLPLGDEDLPPNMPVFDTVLSMGVLYHRRSPIDHLMALRGCLRLGGELALETLVIEGEEGRVLVPEGRYAKMRNVWFIPSCDTLQAWLRRCRFNNVRVVDVTPTSVDEQRRTEWMTFESLVDFLDPDDHTRTVEGLPAPRRAIVVAER